VQTLLCPVQIGRESETAALTAAVVDVARTRTGRTLTLAGEPGVGKSRLAAVAQQLAREHGLLRLVGECTVDASVPYAPFVGAFRRHTRRLDQNALMRLFDGPALLAAALLPEAARAVDLPSDLRPAPEDLLAAVWQLLDRMCADAPALLLVEDLHWADQDTLRLLAYLVREIDDLPLLLIGTYRPDELHRRHPLQALLTELTRERRITEMRLQPLGREQVRQMLSHLFDGTEVGDDFLDALQSRAGGNPFFIEELAKGLVDRGDIYHDGDDWMRRDLGDIEIPDTVRETVLARCADLSDIALRVLQLAALAGDRLDRHVLAAAADVAVADVDDVIRDALRLQLLVERGDGAQTSYAFRHALTREVFADELVGPDQR
jgi:predicted ATPase